MLVLLPAAGSSTPMIAPALSMSTPTHHPTVPHSTSVLPLAFHVFKMSTILLPLFRRQERYRVALTLDIRDLSEQEGCCPKG